MRQRAEHEIKSERRPIDRIERLQGRQVERRELRKHVGHRLAGTAVRRQKPDVHLRMPQQQPHQFRARIAGRAENADFRFCHLRFRHHGSTLIAERTRPENQDAGVRGRILKLTCRAEPAARAFTRERALVPRWYGGAE